MLNLQGAAVNIFQNFDLNAHFALASHFENRCMFEHGLSVDFKKIFKCSQSFNFVHVCNLHIVQVGIFAHSNGSKLRVYDNTYVISRIYFAKF